ncbi:MAG: response regulator [Burkholderiales bacterium]
MPTLGRRHRVLIIDDQEPMRLLLAQFVGQDLGAEVTLAGTCEGALRFLGENTYDVILLDLLMPGIGGIEVLKRVRAESANQSTPVILVTVLAQAQSADERISPARARALGANDLVSKPVNRKTLIAAIKAQLRAAG